MFNSGDPFGARKLLEQTLAASKMSLGANHPQTRQTAQALARVAATFGGRPRPSKPKTQKKGKKKRS
jgi:hypothetical protein